MSDRFLQSLTVTLSEKELNDLLTTLERLCAEAQALQERIRKAMAERARGDMPDHGQGPNPPRKLR